MRKKESEPPPARPVRAGFSVRREKTAGAAQTAVDKRRLVRYDRFDNKKRRTAQ